MAGRLYVLAGKCSLAVGGWSVEIEAGNYADFPEGDFQFRVLGPQDVELVHVWEIPEGYRANRKTAGTDR
jgi:hypothetical protein